MAAGGARRTAALRVLLLLLAATLSAPLALGDDDERLPGWLGEVARLRGGGEGGIIVGRGQQPDPPPAPPVAGLPPLNSVHTDPAAITQVSWAPRAWLYKGFLKPAECGYMIRLATPSMQKSTVVDVSTGKSVPSQIRTSSGTFLRRYHDDVIEDIERRLAEYAMVPADNGEGLQILKYNFGEKYEAHYDYFHDKFNADPSKGGQRVATVLMYLTEVEEGGETVFPASNTPRGPGNWSTCAQRGPAVRPGLGDALLFFSLDLRQELDPASLHASCPVIRGTKWSATKWMHVSAFAQEKRRKGCHNYHDQCEPWALQGECTRNSGYMVGSDGSQGECRKACGACK